MKPRTIRNRKLTRYRIELRCEGSAVKPVLVTQAQLAMLNRTPEGAVRYLAPAGAEVLRVWDGLLLMPSRRDRHPERWLEELWAEQ